MTNKVSLFLAVALALPATAAAQTAPQAPATATPPSGAAPAPQRHRFEWTEADRAKMEAAAAKMTAEMAKMNAAHLAMRAKILGALTPAHKKFYAGLIASLAVSSNPDYHAAAAKLDATLSATEKNRILAIQADAMKQMHAAMQAMVPPDFAMPHGDGMHRFSIRCTKITTDAPASPAPATTTCTNPTDVQPMPMPMPPMPPMNGAAPVPGDRHVVMFRRMGGHDKRPMTAGMILMHLASPGGMAGAPMMLRVRSIRRDGSGHWQHGPATQPTAPVTPVPAPTPAG